MKLLNINISNILGIKELQADVSGNIVEVTGGNGKGKTSVVEAVKSALGMGDLAKMVHEGAEKGEVVLKFDEAEIARKFNAAGKATPEFRKQVGDKMAKLQGPVGIIKSMINGDSVDPIRLLTAKPKEITDAVLQAMPMHADADTLMKITGNHVNTDGHALAVIDGLHSTIFQERTGVNREGKSLKKHHDQLAATLPDNIDDAETIKEQIDEIEQENQKLNDQVFQKCQERDADIAAKDKLIGEGLEQANAELNAKVQELQRQIADNEAKAQQERQQVRDGWASQVEECRLAAANANGDNAAKIATLQERLQNASKVASTAEQCKTLKGKVKALSDKSKGLTSQLNDLQQYKAQLCENLPLPGVEFVGGDLCVDGVPWGQVNTAKRVDLVVRLAEMSAGELGLCVLDNMELMDSDTYARFIERAKETSLTFVISRVGQGPLTVNS